MPFQYSCFISYSDGQGDLMKRFIDELERALQSSLGPYLREGVYIDKKRLSAGYKYNEALAQAICQSVCMIVVYSPIYEKSSYCLREFTAMQRLEEKRFKAMESSISSQCGLIIPILFRGNAAELPPIIREHIHFCDFSRFTTASTKITRHRESVEKIEQIARYIYDLYERFGKSGSDPCSQCTSFRLPAETEVQPWRTPVSPFPMREGIR
ncbi:MAG TPA: toll/interleukin-1 receptor domain-containing protein [Thermoanaerobaculia bacterium]|nr:toll/interleukin-1 receptor domain-containing protein [Thermoanaerobaculia bacterium]